MKRGEVWWADLPAPVGRRPVLLLSRDRAYVVRSAVTVAFLPTVVRGIPVEVRLGPAEGMPKECVVNLDVINTIPKAALVQQITALTSAKLIEVEAAIRFALGMK